MKISIYKITNLINKKVYIGQSTNLRKRISGHKAKAEAGSRLLMYVDMRKYGYVNFHIEEIDTAENHTEGDKKERYYIKEYNSTNPEYGYNSKKGTSRIKPFSSMIEHMKAAQKGFGGGSKGKMRGEAHRARKIKCLENGKIYDCIMDCAEDLFGKDYTKTDRVKISMCAKPESNRFTHKGYSFRYIDKNGEIIEKITKPRSSGTYNRGMKIIEINSGKIFNTIVEAANYYNLATTSIRDRIYKRVIDTKGLDFRNYEEYIANEENPTNKIEGNLVPKLFKDYNK